MRLVSPPTGILPERGAHGPSMFGAGGHGYQRLFFTIGFPPAHPSISFHVRSENRSSRVFFFRISLYSSWSHPGQMAGTDVFDAVETSSCLRFFRCPFYRNLTTCPSPVTEAQHQEPFTDAFFDSIVAFLSRRSSTFRSMTTLRAPSATWAA